MGGDGGEGGGDGEGGGGAAGRAAVARAMGAAVRVEAATARVAAVRAMAAGARARVAAVRVETARRAHVELDDTDAGGLVIDQNQAAVGTGGHVLGGGRGGPTSWPSGGVVHPVLVGTHPGQDAIGVCRTT